jgi:hypothetical protein
MSASWVVFGDDWGRHPSTTQHLFRHIPDADRVLWFNSIGMRHPTFSRKDFQRVAARRFRPPQHDKSRSAQDVPANHRIVSPTLLPFHRSSHARQINERHLRAIWKKARDWCGSESPILVYANPAGAFYAPAFRPRAQVYLRLDHYAQLPGVDPTLVERAEERIRLTTDLVIGTAASLLEDFENNHCLHLPQGVDVEHFGQVAIRPPASKVMGFFGLLAPWLDHRLIEEAALQNPDWTFEFIGKKAAWPASLSRLKNIRTLPPIPYAELPSAIQHWQAAWLPFQVNQLTEHVDPLKIREYLAAGLPTLTTPLPAVSSLGRSVVVTTTSRDVAPFLNMARAESASDRTLRRENIAPQSWASRAKVFRRTILNSTSIGTSVPEQSTAPKMSVA